MQKLLALLLTLCVLFGHTSCSGIPTDSSPVNPDAGNENAGGGENDTVNTGMTLVVPEYKDYGRGTVDFNDIVYSRPNIQGLIDAFATATRTVNEQTKSVDAQIADIRALEDPLRNAETMYTLAQIYNNKDLSVEFWQREYEYISTNFPKLSQSIEVLLIACARSVHKATFEEEYFGYALDEYLDGGIYSDEVVELMAEEARLESEYSSIGTDNVEITYEGSNSNMNWSGTVDEVIAMAREYFKNNDEGFERCLTVIEILYQNAREDIEIPLLIELIKVRRLIADALGYDDYGVLAYDAMGYDYAPEDIMNLIEDINIYAVPVASDLELLVFRSFFNTTPTPRSNKIQVMNTLYEVYSELGGNYKDAFSYMLQHELYDVSENEGDRFDGAFTAYIDTNASPYIFMTASGTVRDYTTLSHEFGHFLDGYINGGDDESLAISEISSQALELLTLTRLRNNVPTRDYSYLEYYTLYSMFNGAILTQSFYAAFEHLVYRLEYDEINEVRVARTMQKAFSLVFGKDASIEPLLTTVAIPHIFLYPFYVESYVTSALVSLDIFFSESYTTGSPGNGFAYYEALIARGDNELSFEERIRSVGLESPFDEGKVKQLSDNVYFHITGKRYYKTNDGNIGAA